MYAVACVRRGCMFDVASSVKSAPPEVMQSDDSQYAQHEVRGLCEISQFLLRYNLRCLKIWPQRSSTQLPLHEAQTGHARGFRVRVSSRAVVTRDPLLRPRRVVTRLSSRLRGTRSIDESLAFMPGRSAPRGWAMSGCGAGIETHPPCKAGTRAALPELRRSPHSQGPPTLYL
jgi:hypothetical protein